MGGVDFFFFWVFMANREFDRNREFCGLGGKGSLGGLRLDISI